MVGLIESVVRNEAAFCLGQVRMFITEINVSSISRMINGANVRTESNIHLSEFDFCATCCFWHCNLNDNKPDSDKIKLYQVYT